MNKYIYTVGAVTLALAMSGLPAIALAENGGGEDGGPVQVTARAGEGGANGQESAARATSSNSIIGGEEQGEGQNEREQEGVPFMLESTTTPAHSFAELRQSIELRKQELADEEASTTPGNQDIVKNANPVRLAVHSLLASKDLLGGIGPQVSEIAKQMNDAVATTTAAETKIQSRGFITRLLFGGDSASAQAIAQAVAQNQENIQKLTDLLNQASTTPDIQATLTAQITALQDAQTRLQALAQSEQKAWGLFSWRF